MYDAEKNDWSKVDYQKKKEIVETAQVSFAELTDLVKKYEAMKGLHQYL